MPVRACLLGACLNPDRTLRPRFGGVAVCSEGRERYAAGWRLSRALRGRLAAQPLLASPTGQLTPVPPRPQ
jgi:hypothetical protein